MVKMEKQNGWTMMSFGALVRLSVLFAFTGTTLLLTCLSARADDEKNKPVVSVNGVVKTERHLSEAMKKIVPGSSFHGGLSEEKLKKYRPEAINSLIDDELMFQRAEELSMKVKSSEVRALREATIERLGGKREFKAALKSHDMSNRQYKKEIRRRLLVEKFIKEKIDQTAVMGDDEVRMYYEENISMYVRPEARRVRHIFIKVPSSFSGEHIEARRVRAEAVLEKLHNGEDFAALAWDYSDGPYRVKGGDMGMLHRGRLDPKLEEELYELEEGQLSGIVRTVYGFHIMKVDKIHPEEQLSFEKVKGDIRSSLEKTRLVEAREAVMSSLRENAEIEVFEE